MIIPAILTPVTALHLLIEFVVERMIWTRPPCCPGCLQLLTTPRGWSSICRGGTAFDSVRFATSRTASGPCRLRPTAPPATRPTPWTTAMWTLRSWSKFHVVSRYTCENRFRQLSVDVVWGRRTKTNSVTQSWYRVRRSCRDVKQRTKLRTDCPVVSLLGVNPDW